MHLGSKLVQALKRNGSSKRAQRFTYELNSNSIKVPAALHNEICSVLQNTLKLIALQKLF